jgi:sodium/bile acid cotransporter 7
LASFLLKRWFLLLLTGGVALACLYPEVVRPLVGRLAPQPVVALALFLMAWGLDSRRLGLALTRPGPVLWALAVSYGLLPSIAWAAGALLPSPDLRVGLLIIASVPCTLASAVLWTRLAGGNEAVALLVVLLGTAVSWLVTTLWLTMTTPARVDLDSAGLMQNLAVVLVVPVALGQGIRLLPRAAEAAARYKTPLGIISRALILAILLRAAMGLGEHTAGVSAFALALTVLVCVAVHLTALVVGLVGGRALGFARADGIAAAFAGSQKTLPVGLFLFEAYYKSEYPLAVVPLVLYHVGQLVIDTFVADRLAAGRNGKPP